MKAIISICLLTVLSTALMLSYAQPRCMPGSFNPNAGREPCIACRRGTYSRKIGKKRCRRCKKGYSTIIPWSRSKWACTKCPNDLSSCQFCRPGFSGPNGIEPCSPCKSGTASAGGESRCRSCDIFSGYITGGEKADHCMRCPSGAKPNVGDFCIRNVSSCSSTDPDAPSSCRLCQPGSSSDTGFEPCSPCPRGEISDTFGAKLCMPCKFRTFTPFSGARSIGICEPSMPNGA